MKETSRLAYEKIKKSGMLSRARFEVYEVLAHHGPCTGREVSELLGGNPSAHKRLSELQRMGAIEEHDERECKHTGHVATTWELTGNLPTKLEKAPKERPFATITLEMFEEGKRNVLTVRGSTGSVSRTEYPFMSLEQTAGVRIEQGRCVGHNGKNTVVMKLWNTGPKFPEGSLNT